MRRALIFTRLIFKGLLPLFVVVAIGLTLSILIGRTWFNGWGIFHVYYPDNQDNATIALLDSERGLSVPLVYITASPNNRLTSFGNYAFISPNYQYRVENSPVLGGSQLVHLRTNTVTELPVFFYNLPLPLWSPDSQYVYLSGSQLDVENDYVGTYVAKVNADGTADIITIEHEELTPGQPQEFIRSLLTAAWSPDSSQLVFVSRIQPDHLMVYDVASGETRTILDDPEARFSGLTWIPSTNQVIYMRSDSSTSSSYSVQTINVEDSTVLYDTLIIDTGLVWSPTGEYYASAFNRKVHIRRFEETEDYNVNIDILTADNVVQWSPDGEQVAFVGWQDNQIYVVDVDGTNLRRVTSDEGDDYRLLE